MVRAGVRRDRLPAVVHVTGRAEPGEVFEPPIPLKGPALEFWTSVAPTLAEAGVIEHVDRYALALTAEAWRLPRSPWKFVAAVGV